MPNEQPSPTRTHEDITPPSPKRRRWIRGEKITPAFWTVASLISILVNIVLVIVLIALGKELFQLKQVVEKQVLGGLYQNFVQMDDAHIRTTIPISAEVPAKFDLAVNTNTEVVLTADTVVNNTIIYNFNAGELTIRRAVTNIILPAGTKLPVALNITVPVDQKIPVKMNVDVDIPLKQTELHQPFVGLRDVVSPYVSLMGTLPNTWQETLCGKEPSLLCQKLVP